MALVLPWKWGFMEFSFYSALLTSFTFAKSSRKYKFSCIFSFTHWFHRLSIFVYFSVFTPLNDCVSARAGAKSAKMEKSKLKWTTVSERNELFKWHLWKMAKGYSDCEMSISFSVFFFTFEFSSLSHDWLHPVQI